MNMSEFRVDELISEVYDIFHYQCKLKKLALINDSQECIKTLVAYSDKCRIKQILLNLLSNAFKFTFKGRITIGCKVSQINNGEYLVFTVSDTGIGIKKEDQSGLFRLFGMITNKNGLNPNGWGIGLTVSKKYIQHLGGEINFQSTYGVGTTISFTIPLIRHPGISTDCDEDMPDLALDKKGSSEKSILLDQFGSDKYAFSCKTMPSLNADT